MIVVAGLLAMLAPFAGVFGTVVAMIGAFNDASASGEAATTSELATGIRASFEATAWGLLIGIFGFALVLLGVIGLGNRERWIYRNLLVVAVLWCVLLFPLGTLCGGVVLYTLFNRRSEFNPPRQHSMGRGNSDVLPPGSTS